MGDRSPENRLFGEFRVDMERISITGRFGVTIDLFLGNLVTAFRNGVPDSNPAMALSCTSAHASFPQIREILAVAMSSPS